LRQTSDIGEPVPSDSGSRFEVATISRRRWLDWLPIVAGTLLAITMLDAARHRIVGSLDTAAFGRDTQNVVADIDSIHAHCSVAEDSKECLDGYAAAGKPPAILWLGNSQLAAINRYKDGDRTASSLLYERLRKRGYHLVTYSQPNANLFEHGLVELGLGAFIGERLGGADAAPAVGAVDAGFAVERDQPLAHLF